MDRSKSKNQIFDPTYLLIYPSIVLKAFLYHRVLAYFVNILSNLLLYFGCVYAEFVEIGLIFGEPFGRIKAMKEKRISQLEEYIRKNEVVTIEELCDTFQVSVNTIRRDLNQLSDKGIITKIYGGARSAEVTESTGALLPYPERFTQHSEEKARIARAASKLVHENDTIFLDTGTSTVPVLGFLSHLNHITVITNSIYVLQSSINYPQFTTIALPGVVKPKAASLVGEQCLSAIQIYHINKAFFACTSFSLEAGASNASPEEYAVKQAVLQNSSEHILLVDSSKFDRSSLLTYAKPDAFQHIITDKKPDDRYLRYFEEHGIRLLVEDS